MPRSMPWKLAASRNLKSLSRGGSGLSDAEVPLTRRPPPPGPRCIRGGWDLAGTAAAARLEGVVAAQEAAAAGAETWEYEAVATASC